MRKICFLLAVWSVVLLSCSNNTQQKEVTEPLCMASYEEAYNKFTESVENKEFKTLESISATQFGYDTIFANYDNISVKLIPKTEDGAYGIFNRNESQIYYLFISDNNNLKDARVLQLKENNGCFKVWNFTKFAIDQELKELFHK